LIKSFRNKALASLWEEGTSRRIDARLHGRIMRRLDALDRAAEPDDMNVPGFNFHALRGHRPTRYTVHVNGPWCITFEFEDGDAYRVDFEQYH
jgi:proteic killer suppression protein